MARHLYKILSVFFLVGVGQVLSIWFVSYITTNNGVAAVGSVAKFDAALMLLMSVLSIGVGQYFPRYLISDKTYKVAINDARVLRILVALPLMIAGGCFYLLGQIEYSLVFSTAILFALGVEYALYVRNQQINAAFCSFLKVSGIYVVFIVLVWSGIELGDEMLPYTYFIAFVGFSVIASVVSIFSLKERFLVRWKTPDRKVIFGVAQLGGAFFLYSSAKSLIIPVGDLALSDSDVVDLYIFLKLYLLVFSVRRVYVQIIHQWLVDLKKAATFNIIFLFLGVVFVVFYLAVENIFSIELFGALLGLNVKWPLGVLLVLLALSVFSVYPTRLLLLEGDNAYKLILISLSVVFLLALYFSAVLFGFDGIVVTVAVFELLVGFCCYIYCRILAASKGVTVRQ